MKAYITGNYKLVSVDQETLATENLDWHTNDCIDRIYYIEEEGVVSTTSGVIPVKNGDIVMSLYPIGEGTTGVNIVLNDGPYKEYITARREYIKNRDQEELNTCKCSGNSCGVQCSNA